MTSELTAPLDGRRIRLAERPRRPDAQVALMSEHVLYEVEAFGALDELTRRYGRFDERDFPAGTEAWWLGNVTIESFLIRARGLDDFLYGDVLLADRKEEPIELGDDVSALDFVADQQAWLNARPQRSIDLRRRRISRAVVHLTWARVETGWEEGSLSSFHQADQKGQHWPVGEIWNAMRPGLSTFLEHLDDGIARDDLRERAERALTGRALGS